MRALVFALAAALIPAAASAQAAASEQLGPAAPIGSSSATVARAYANFAGGFAVTPDTTSGDVGGELGVRVAPNLFVFGNVGRFSNVQPSTFQPTIDATTTSLSTGGLSVTGTASVPAWYTLGGARYLIPVGRVSPYVFGGLGFARLTPTATFTYTSGTLPGSTPTTGDDVTSQLEAIGDFTPPAATTSLMLAFGGGIEAPVAPHLVVDVGYRVSHIAADTPFNAQSVTFGFGYRF